MGRIIGIRINNNDNTNDNNNVGGTSGEMR